MSDTFELYGKKYELAPLDAIEMAYFDSQLQTLFGTVDSIERQLIMERRELILLAVRAVKQSISSHPTFRGIYAGDTELGFSPIRPVHTKRGDGVGAMRDTWDHAVSAETWADWLASSTANTGYLLDKRMGQIILYLKSYVSPTPFASEVQFSIGRTKFLPYDFRSIRLGDNKHNVSLYPLPTMFVMPSTDELFADLFADVAGTENLALGGLSIGLGAFLKNTTSVTWQT
jgi:hypothetical protein